MSPGRRTPQRVRTGHIDWVQSRLSDRDRCVLQTVAILRLVTGKQLQVTCFKTLTGQSQTVARGRVLSRLVSWRVLQVVDRRVGGPQHGSASAVYALDSAGIALTKFASTGWSSAPSSRFAAHTLGISQLYADVVAAVDQRHDIELAAFGSEPDCWVPDGLGHYLKPDAYLELRCHDLALHHWVEVDRSTESLRTLERKLRTYLSFVERGQLGPGGVVPRVLVTVIDDRRHRAVADLVARLPKPAPALFVVERDTRAAHALLAAVQE